jgi:ArsR family transcriptional regulator
MHSEVIFRALADGTRLRIARLLGAMELAVGELAQVLGQSQPRVSRHVSILCAAGLAERRREGSWVFIRGSSFDGNAQPLALEVSRLLAALERADPELAAACAKDRERLAEISAAREENATAYFAALAEQWDELRQMHSPDGLVENALVAALDGQPLGRLLDIGTGTGRMAEMFAPAAERITALDKSLDMLRLARAKLQHLPPDRLELVQGDFTALPFAAFSFDTVLLHQVLHFAQDPAAALAEAARVTRPGGRIAIVDFAAHDREELRERHAHARLGFTDDQIARLLTKAGCEVAAPLALEGGALIVKIWIANKPAAPFSASVQKVSA